MYVLIFTEDFNHTYKKLIKGNEEKEKKFKKTILLLQQEPFYPSLKTHKANTKNYGKKWSSWITGDLRIIWDFDEEQNVTILLLTIGSHSGSHKEYK
ncbi:MAG: type II toxin-antitoxin system YafQ family toxin [Patescibacteria group bacterium]|nr:type II toxin-antitoxin system YafQ family toxin [Patescibacteria group bacterium]